MRCLKIQEVTRKSPENLALSITVLMSPLPETMIQNKICAAVKYIDFVKSWNSRPHTKQQTSKHLQLATVKQSPATQSAAHLGAAVHHEALQVAESDLSTAHLTGGEDSARNRLVLGRQLKREVGEGTQCHYLRLIYLFHMLNVMCI